MADVDLGTIPGWEEVAERVSLELEAYEIVDGQVILTVGALRPHQHVVTALQFELTMWARANDAIVMPQPFDVPTTRTRMRQPDLFVVTAAHRDRVTHRAMRGAPDLVVEVLSRSTRRVDLGTKLMEYAGLGVAEYCCIDTIAGKALVATPPDWPWRPITRGGTWTSTALPGFSVPLDRILPPPEDAAGS